MVPVACHSSKQLGVIAVRQLHEFVTLFTFLAPRLDGTVSLSTVQIAAVAWLAVFTRVFKAMVIFHWSEQRLFL